MNSQFLISGTGVSMELQWFGDKDSFNQELQNSGILSFPGYKVAPALEICVLQLKVKVKLQA